MPQAIVLLIFFLIQRIIDNLISPEYRDFIQTPDLDKNRLRQLRYKDLLDE